MQRVSGRTSFLANDNRWQPVNKEGGFTQKRLHFVSPICEHRARRRLSRHSAIPSCFEPLLWKKRAILSAGSWGTLPMLHVIYNLILIFGLWTLASGVQEKSFSDLCWGLVGLAMGFGFLIDSNQSARRFGVEGKSFRMDGSFYVLFACL